MTSEEYIKHMVEEVRTKFINDTWFGTPYICEFGQDENDIRPITTNELKDLYSNAESANYFTDDDGIDGGIIERVASEFNKLLPIDNDMDMRDYPSFFFVDEECKYYVFYLDRWPEKRGA